MLQILFKNETQFWIFSFYLQISKGVLPDKKLELERNDTAHYRNEETYKVIEEEEEVVEEVEDVIEEEEVVVEEEELVEEEVVVEEENLERNGFHTSNNNGNKASQF